MQLKFLKPTSLVSLNLDLMFTCKNSEELVNSLACSEEQIEGAVSEQLPLDKNMSTSSSNVKTNNLGLFSIQSVHESSEDNKDS